MRRYQTVLFFIAAIAAYSQIAPFQADGIHMSGTSTQLMAVPAVASPTLLNVAVDTSGAGGDFLDVAVGDPSVLISLITPGGTEVTAGNAASYGFTFSTYSADSSSDSLNPLTSGGAHTLIQFSAPQISGTYQVKADASSASADTGMIVQYYSSSAVRTGAVADSPQYRLGDLVATSLLLFDGTTPVQGATVTATAVATVPLPSASVGNYQLVSQPTITLYTYTAQLTNSGTSATSVSAQVSSSDPNTTVVDSDVLFGDVAANSTATSLNTFSVQLLTNSTLNPSVLNWKVSTPSAPISFALTDSGAYDEATGDGIYTGTFTPSVKGNYTVYMTASGTSSSGAAFSRTATAAFQVSDPLARIGALSDAPVYNSNGLIDHVAITAPVSVQAAGTYRLALDLQAGNGKSIQAITSMPLNTGSQQMVLSFPFASLLSLGTNGPYTEAHARLILVSNSDSTLADYIDNAGYTQTYSQSSVSPGPLAFTGQNTAVGVVTGAGPTFDVLRVTVGLYSASTRSCSWSGALTDLGGNQIAYSYSTGSVTAGTNSITLSFNGNQIAAAANGPYLIKYVGVYCGNAQAAAGTLFQTQSFSASQFTFVSSDFTLAVQSSPASALPGSTFRYKLYVTAVGPFSALVHLSVGGLPTGATASFNVPDVKGFGPSYLNVTTSASTPPGVYTLTIGGTSGTLSHTAGATLTVQGSGASSSSQVAYVNAND